MEVVRVELIAAGTVLLIENVAKLHSHRLRPRTGL